MGGPSRVTRSPPELKRTYDPSSSALWNALQFSPVFQSENWTKLEHFVDAFIQSERSVCFSDWTNGSAIDRSVDRFKSDCRDRVPPLPVVKFLSPPVKRVRVHTSTRKKRKNKMCRFHNDLLTDSKFAYCRCRKHTYIGSWFQLHRELPFLEMTVHFATSFRHFPEGF